MQLADPGQEDRKSRGIPVVPVFDGYRAVAIFGIVLLHLTAAGPGGETWFRIQTATLGQAIDILFIVSGFVVFLPTAAQGKFGSVKSYAVRRAARLLPAYWMILLIVLLLGVIGPPLSPVFHPPLQAIALHISGFQTVGFFWETFGAAGFGVIGPIWTLTVEISFYLVLPLVAMSFYRHPAIGLVIAGAIGVAWAWLGTHPFQVADFLDTSITLDAGGNIYRSTLLQFPFWIFSFALGMMGAKVYVKALTMDPGRVRRIAARAQLVALAFLLFFAVLVYHVDPGGGGIFLVAEDARTNPLIMLGYSSALAVLMVSIALGPEWVKRPFDNRPVRWLAEISYGVYLSHMMFVWIALWGIGYTYGGDMASLAAWIGAVVPLSMLYGYLSARFLEQPIRRWVRKYGREPKPG